MIPGLSEGVLSMFFSKLDQQKLCSKWELDSHYSSQSNHSDVMTTCNWGPNNFCTTFDIHRCTIEEESEEEDTVPVTNANMAADMDSKSLDAVNGSALVPKEEEKPLPAAANVTTTADPQLSEVEVACVAMILEDDHKSGAANIVVLISSEVSSTPQESLGVLPDTAICCK